MTQAARPLFGDPVRVDTFPAARWRVIAPAEGDEPGLFRLVRMDRTGGRRVELAGIPASRLVAA